MIQISVMLIRQIPILPDMDRFILDVVGLMAMKRGLNPRVWPSWHIIFNKRFYSILCQSWWYYNGQAQNCHVRTFEHLQTHPSILITDRWMGDDWAIQKSLLCLQAQTPAIYG